MKILYTVESYLPVKNGMSEVVDQLSSRLFQLGHEVTVATSYHPSNLINHRGVKIKRFKISGNMIRGINGKSEEYKNFLLKSKFDVITNFAAQQWATDLMLPILNNIKAKKIFVPTGFSNLYDKKYIEYFSQMSEWMRSYDMNIFLSNNYRDINFAREHGIRNIAVIPNGADEREFSKKITIDIRKIYNIPQNHQLIILVGSHTGLKGHRQAIEIFNRASITDSTFMIIGDLKTSCYYECIVRSFIQNVQKKSKKIIIADMDRRTTIAAYQQADLFLFPSSIECSPIVLFEAAASKTPFLVTDVGNSKEIIQWLGGGELLPTTMDSNGISYAKIEQGARLLSEILLNKSRLKFLAEKGYTNWRQK